VNRTPVFPILTMRMMNLMTARGLTATMVIEY
jgi:hypothetical protein